MGDDVPYMPNQQRWQGAHVARIPDPHDGGPCTCDWSDPANWTAANLMHRRLPMPDQSRYGPHGSNDSPRLRADGRTPWPRETDSKGDKKR